ncbi:hypothetical protein SPRG_14428, partial [Saprolegnia parasitica CBS 223.65]
RRRARLLRQSERQRGHVPQRHRVAVLGQSRFRWFQPAQCHVQFGCQQRAAGRRVHRCRRRRRLGAACQEDGWLRLHGRRLRPPRRRHALCLSLRTLSHFLHAYHVAFLSILVPPNADHT